MYFGTLLLKTGLVSIEVLESLLSGSHSIIRNALLYLLSTSEKKDRMIDYTAAEKNGSSGTSV